MNIVAIGDIHGCVDQLKTLIDSITIHEDTCLVFLGDYIDVGPASKDVIEFLCNLRQHHLKCCFLSGNHEQYLLDYLADGDLVRYAKYGGIATLKSYIDAPHGEVHSQFLKTIPSHHVDFLKSLRTHAESASVLLSHCGLSPIDPKDRSPKAMLQSNHQALFSQPLSMPLFCICGHYFTTNALPRLTTNALCIDTGCGIKCGPLSAFSFEAQILHQVDPAGRYRSMVLSFSEFQIKLLHAACTGPQLSFGSTVIGAQTI